jgi:hypothetical protein
MSNYLPTEASSKSKFPSTNSYHNESAALWVPGRNAGAGERDGVFLARAHPGEGPFAVFTNSTSIDASFPRPRHCFFHFVSLLCNRPLSCGNKHWFSFCLSFVHVRDLIRGGGGGDGDRGPFVGWLVLLVVICKCENIQELAFPSTFFWLFCGVDAGLLTNKWARVDF